MSKQLYPNLKRQHFGKTIYARSSQTTHFFSCNLLIIVVVVDVVVITVVTIIAVLVVVTVFVVLAVRDVIVANVVISVAVALAKWTQLINGNFLLNAHSDKLFFTSFF